MKPPELVWRMSEEESRKADTPGQSQNEPWGILEQDSGRNLENLPGEVVRKFQGTLEDTTLRTWNNLPGEVSETFEGSSVYALFGGN